MAKKSVVWRNNHRKKTYERCKEKRQKLMEAYTNESDIEKKWRLRLEFQKLPKNSAKNRICSRCSITGRGHAVYSKFQMSRIKLRENFSLGVIPGLTKSSW